MWRRVWLFAARGGSVMDVSPWKVQTSTSPQSEAFPQLMNNHGCTQLDNNKNEGSWGHRCHYKFVFTVLSGCEKKINVKYRTKREQKQLKCAVLEFLWWRWLIVFLSGSVAHCFSVLGASYSNYHVGRACVAAFTVLWLTKCLDCWPSTVMH